MAPSSPMTGISPSRPHIMSKAVATPTPGFPSDVPTRRAMSVTFGCSPPGIGMIGGPNRLTIEGSQFFRKSKSAAITAIIKPFPSVWKFPTTPRGNTWPHPVCHRHASRSTQLECNRSITFNASSGQSSGLRKLLRSAALKRGTLYIYIYIYP